MPTCKAHSKRTGEPCRALAVGGRDYCRMHGGTAPVGIANPAYKHGRYSKALTGALAKRYEEMQADPDVLSMRSEASLVSSRIIALLDGLYGAAGGEAAGGTWAALQKAHDKMMQAAQNKDVAGIAQAIPLLGKAIEDGRREAATWAEVADLVQLRAKVVDTETKRVVAMEQMVKLDELMALAGGIVSVLRDCIPEKRLLAEVVGRIEGMLTGAGTDGNGRRA